MKRNVSGKRCLKSRVISTTNSCTRSSRGKTRRKADKGPRSGRAFWPAGFHRFSAVQPVNKTRVCKPCRAVLDYLPSPLDRERSKMGPLATGREKQVGQGQRTFLGPLFLKSRPTRTSAGSRSPGRIREKSTRKAWFSIHAQKTSERITRIFRMHSNRRNRKMPCMRETSWGLAGLKDTTNGRHDLRSFTAGIVRADVFFRSRSSWRSIEPKAPPTQDKLQAALLRLAMKIRRARSRSIPKPGRR